MKPYDPSPAITLATITDDSSPAFAAICLNGASKALLNGKSLLAAGVIKINGSFEKGENVLILDQNMDLMVF